jgi:2-polyprenyl-3-methyl-5-hydroxy-6-metoxy-1,4-benzoquinol methylase
MKSTPVTDVANEDLLAVLPKDVARVVEIGCGGGALAKAYRASNPATEYIGVEVDAEYAELARRHCSRALCANIETMSDDELGDLTPADCWVFGDVLEHLYDPWQVLARLKVLLRPADCVVACVPNAQHWSVQLRLMSGEFWYEPAGLLDRTHIRFFTRVTLSRLFHDAGLRIVLAQSRVFNFEGQETALAGIREWAKSMGHDAEACVQDATPFQYLLKAIPS